MSVPDLEPYLGVAVLLADTARPILQKYYRSGVGIEDKPDATPVTIADRAAEAAMRQLINQHCPGHGIKGEEYGDENLAGDFVWVLDPIDGTKAFMTGKPLFGTLIALCYQGRPVIGIIDMAVLAERFVGVRGRGASRNGVPIKTRACAHLSQAALYATTPYMFTGAAAANFNNLALNVKYPLFGADCYGYGLVASGFADLVVEAQLKPYDYLACAVVVTEAGGVAVDWHGRDLTLASGDQVVVSGDARLVPPVLALLNR
ncbi:MAG: inositol monophosphatase family protein [Candidatus Symbiobacter sp.]|nr:inositol monophosphatase family protein [Candidatus Symbiobacter sp.]